MALLQSRMASLLWTWLLIALANRAVNAKELLPEESVNYMKKYGYLNSNSGSGELRTEESVMGALKQLQSFAGLAVTGRVDADTRRLLETPRCGMKDMEKQQGGRAKRYMLQGTYWKKRELTFRVADYTSDLSSSDVRRTIHAVLGKWQAATNLKFKETSATDADIIVRFVRGYHKDPYTFDGRGGTLAHAFYPHDNTGLAGDVHFDDDETFTLGKSSGTNFYWVALHELGHSIGLEHSNKKGAVMYPWYQGYKGEDVALTHDDVVGIQHIYGSPDNGVTVPTTTRRPVTVPNATAAPAIPAVPCLNRVQAVILGRDMRTYVFNGDLLHIMDTNLVLVGKPILISRYFPGLSRVDAVYKRTDGKIAFFYQDKYWVYMGRRRLEGPNDIKRYGLTAGMSDMDAAFVRKQTGKTYFFKKDRYWRYDDARRQLDRGYPKRISTGWKGVAGPVDAVFQWRNKATYFFKGPKYYRIDKRSPAVIKGYPRPIAGDFSICRPLSGDMQNRLGSSATSVPATKISVILPLGLVLVAKMFLP